MRMKIVWAIVGSISVLLRGCLLRYEERVRLAIKIDELNYDPIILR